MAFKDFMQGGGQLRGGGGGGGGGRGGGGGGGGGRNNAGVQRRRQKSRDEKQAKRAENKAGAEEEETVGPALPELDSALGLNATNTGGTNGAFGMQSAGFGLGNKPLFSDNSEYEQGVFKENPQAGFNAFASSAGMSPMGQDNFGQWLQRQYDIEQANYQTLAADDQNQNLTWYDYLGNLAGVQYGKPGWEDAYKQFWMGRYANDSMANRGLSDAPYQGQTRWLAIG